VFAVTWSKRLIISFNAHVNLAVYNAEIAYGNLDQNFSVVGRAHSSTPFGLGQAGVGEGNPTPTVRH
jgi:hypothetical protein